MSHESDLRARLATAENEAMYLTRERDTAVAQRDVLASALRVVTSRIQMIPKHQRMRGDDDAIAYAIEALAGLEES